MTINHGLYTDTVWAVPVTFRDTSGDPIDLSGYPYVAELVANAGVVFRFKSAGAAAGEGTLGLANAATGVIAFNASIAQHASVTSGLYRVHLKRDLADDVWAAEGSMLVGAPGAKETYLLFDDPGADSAAAITYAQQAALSAAAAAASATAAGTEADAAAASAVAADASADAAAASQVSAEADAIGTAADRVQTGIDRAAAAASVSSAAASEAAATGKAGEAATSATAAASARVAAEAARDSASTSAATSTTKAAEASASAAAAGAAVVDEANAVAQGLGALMAAFGQAWEEIQKVMDGQDDNVMTAVHVLNLAQILGQLTDQVNGGRITLAGGTLADPAIRIGTAGIYSSAANTLSVVIAGVERLRVTASGITVYGTVTQA